MQSLGVKLRLERERQQLALAKIAEDTRISQRYLEAIEADDLTALPGDFFFRAFVRQYSKYLGWNPDEVEQQINLVSAPPASENTLPPASPETLSITRDRTSTAQRDTIKDKPIVPVQDDGISKRWLAFAVLVIVACGAYFAWRNFSPAQEQPVAQAPKPAPVVQQPAPVAAPPPAPVETAPVTAAPVPAPPPVEKAAVPASAGQISLVVRAKQMTWIRITADGTKVYGGTIDAGQERTITARDVELIVGNAGTLDVIYNGKPLEYGSKGEVKTLLLNSTGWKFKPKPQADNANPTTSPAASATGNNSAGASAPGTF